MVNKEKIWFEEEKRPYTIRCKSKRYLICTKPYNFKKNTVQYTIVDFERNVRGVSNLIFECHDYYSDEDCLDALKMLESGEMEVSSRTGKYIPLKITKEIFNI